MKFKSVKAVGNWVALKAVASVANEEAAVNENGIILPEGEQEAAGTRMNNPNGNGKTTVRIYVDSVGETVPKDVAFKVGDEVLVNDYDLQSVGDDEGNIYGLVHYNNVKAVIETE